MGNNTSKKTQEIIEYYNKLNKFTCSICFEENIDKIALIYCKHEICKRCYHFIEKKICPLCRNKMVLLSDKKKYTIP